MENETCPCCEHGEMVYDHEGYEGGEDGYEEGSHYICDYCGYEEVN